jgi:DNA-binding NtrC family response regulator
MSKNHERPVMLIDDDPGILEMTKMVLEELGYPSVLIEAPKDCEEIIRKVSDYNPFIIFLDLWMPSLRGEDITKNLKANSKFYNLPIVIVSAHKDVGKVAKEIGADDFIEKPFDISRLESLIKKYC